VRKRPKRRDQDSVQGSARLPGRQPRRAGSGQPENSYQSAFSHYLAGFVYEALGEKDLAAPGYRKAAELRPNTPLLEQALVNLDKPSKSDDSDILIVVQSGLAPSRFDPRAAAIADLQQCGDHSTVVPDHQADTSTAPLRRSVSMASKST
jgi:hypothetical protein